MSALSDKIAEVSAKVDAATSRVQADIANLKQQIADLQAKVDAGGATQQDMDDLQSRTRGRARAGDDTRPGGFHEKHLTDRSS